MTFSPQIRSWLQDSDPVVITYFCNMSVNPLPKHLLSSLCYQIGRSYHCYCPTKQGPFNHNEADPELNCYDSPKDIKSYFSASSDSDVHNGSSFKEHDSKAQCTESDPSLSELKQHLSTLMSALPSRKYPLVLLLDGLEQLENDFGLQVIESLPSPLPARVKLLLTVSSDQNHFVQAIELHYPQCSTSSYKTEVGKKSRFLSLQLGQANRKECIKMLASLLCSSGRRITSGQQALVNQALTSCCLTLYTRFLHVHASLWHSGTALFVKLI